MIIYKVTCLINNKIYIGLTKRTLHIRKTQHLKDSKNGCNFIFHKAIRKHNKENFIWEIIEECNNFEELKQKEIYWINFFNSNNFKKGYNMTSGGEGTLNKKHSEETKQKIKRKSIPFCDILNELKSIGYKILLKEKDYKGIFQDAYFICNNGHKYKTFLHSIIKRKCRCNICNKRIKYSEIKESYEKEQFQLLTTQKQYYKSKNGAKQLKVICNNGHKNISNFHNFKTGTRCLKCFYENKLL